MSDIIVRMATPADAEALVAIYAPYVEKTCISYEYEVPTVEEFAGRIARTLEKYPYLVVEYEGEIWGYAYASDFHPRTASQWCAAKSVYMREAKRGQGLGPLLYGVLEDCLKRQGIIRMYACIAYTDTPDEYLTQSSANFHGLWGFMKTGHFYKCAYKFGRWYDMVWMQKNIGTLREDMPPVKPYAEAKEQGKQDKWYCRRAKDMK